MSTLNIRPLNADLQQVARHDLHENPDRIQESLDILRKWLKKSSHLTTRTDDQFLVAFLRRCKFSIESAKQLIDVYYTYRTRLSEFFENRDPMVERTSEVIKLGVTLPLPIIGNPGSPRILFVRVNVYDPTRVSGEDAFKVLTMINDVLANEDDNSVVSGHIFVVDMANISIGHVAQFQPELIKKVIMLWHESSPIRQKAVHYINAPKIFEQVFALFKSMLSEKMKKRFFLHSSMDTFYSMVPQEHMPSEYGGEAGSLHSLSAEWEKKLFSYREYFSDDRVYGVDEEKRIGAPPPNPLVGVDGTFQQFQEN